MEGLFFISIWLVIIVLLAVLILLFIWMWTIVTSKIPFFPVANSILPYINKALNLNDKSVVYHLACGDAQVLEYIAKVTPKAEYVGIENRLFPLLLARFRIWSSKQRKVLPIKIINNDLFEFDISKATHVILYAPPAIMDNLLPRFDQVLKNGTRLVSISFPFTQKRHALEIDLERGEKQLTRKLYVYEF